MDQPCTYVELRDCLASIAAVNRLTFAYRPTLAWLGHVYTRLPRQTRPLRILDLGSGYGDTLRRVHRWATDLHLPVELVGVDLNPDAVRAAREMTPPDVATFLAGSIFDYTPPPGGIDLVITSLVMHHLQDAEIVRMLDWMESHARIGWFINDLERQPLPYHVFRAVARVMPWHPFVKADGPVSILRSFRVEDWRRLLAQAAIPRDVCQVRTWWPARLCVARVRQAGV